MGHFSFAEYLERRRPKYTQQSLLLEQLRQHSAFRSAVSSEDIETFLNDRDAPWGVRENQDGLMRTAHQFLTLGTSSVERHRPARACPFWVLVA